MDIALAMKYGGAPVSPDECDESSFKMLGLTCPCCKDLVRWIAPQEREVKGSVYPVKSHFRHFPTTDPVVAANCERRTSILPKQEIEKLARKAIQQRAKDFDRWFWMVIDAHVTRVDLHADEDLEDIMWKKGEFDDVELVGLMGQLIDEFASVAYLAQEAAQSFLADFQLEADVMPVIQQHLGYGEENLIPAWLENMHRLANHPLHRQIASEAISFLATKRSRALLRALVMWILVSSEMMNSWMEQKEQHTHLVYVTCEMLGRLVALVPWADEFDRLKGKDDVPVPNKSLTGVLFRIFVTPAVEDQAKRIKANSLLTSSIGLPKQSKSLSEC